MKIDGQDPRSPTTELRRIRLSVPGPQSLPTFSHTSFNPGQAKARVDWQASLGTTSEKSVTSVMRSIDANLAGSGLQSPETVSRSSVRRSDSTLPYSTDWTSPEPEDTENEFDTHINEASSRATSTRRTTAATREVPSSPVQRPREGSSHRSLK
jgi:hypothetical protein